ncbi:MAG: hypothetical protein IT423_00960 [Pirellulaceae bacterium]|nr:hypothetical protein [Pirellulaceae bacterium]
MVRLLLSLICLSIVAAYQANQVASQTVSQPVSEPVSVGPLVKALWFVHQHGTAAALLPENDSAVKFALTKALAQDSQISFDELSEFVDVRAFEKAAGADRHIDVTELDKLATVGIPRSRKQLSVQAVEHADYLTTSFDRIDAVHAQAGQKLADWIVAHYEPQKTEPQKTEQTTNSLQTSQPLNVVVVCTGNSRRSIMGATMGNLAAAYYGFENIRFHSGGTTPSAFNARTVRALSDIGFTIEATGDQAERGDVKTANPIYRITCGQALTVLEFSKHYAHPHNPQANFAALLVCSEADAECPLVKGAALRVPMPYQDPKIYDGSKYETDKYAERRDDIGRLMLSVMAQARRKIELSGKD